MTATAIDVDALNSLFDKQKKLDDIFSSMFEDEGSLFNNSTSNNEQSFKSNSWEDDQGFHFDEDLSFDHRDETLVDKKKNIIYLALPLALEIAAIYFGISYFY